MSYLLPVHTRGREHTLEYGQLPRAHIERKLPLPSPEAMNCQYHLNWGWGIYEFFSLPARTLTGLILSEQTQVQRAQEFRSPVRHTQYSYAPFLPNF